MVDIIRYEDGKAIGKNGRPIFCLPGDRFTNNKGESFTVVDYITAMDIIIRFDCGTEATTSAAQIRKGKARNPKTTSVNGKGFSVDVGDRFTNRDGAVAEVVERAGDGKAKVVFLATGYELVTLTKNLHSGKDFKDPYHPSKFGVGYCGTKYPCEKERHYHLWSGMLQRCYACDYSLANQTYKDVYVEDFLLSYENFYELVDSKEGFHLGYEMDKDLLIKGNKVYSRESICFLPKIINVAIQGGKSNIDKSMNLPLGVFYRKDTGKYRAISGEYGKLKDCGQYDNPLDAFNAYKESKELYLKELALQYKDTLEAKAFAALMNYSVEITD